jgi:hypothetical protein
MTVSSIPGTERSLLRNSRKKKEEEEKESNEKIGEKRKEVKGVRRERE